MVGPEDLRGDSLRKQILSALASGEMTATELHDRVAGGEAAHVSQSQVLASAATMVEEGLVEGVFTRRGRSSQTQVFSLTPSGQAAAGVDQAR